MSSSHEDTEDFHLKKEQTQGERSPGGCGRRGILGVLRGQRADAGANGPRLLGRQNSCGKDLGVLKLLPTSVVFQQLKLQGATVLSRSVNALPSRLPARLRVPHRNIRYRIFCDQGLTCSAQRKRDTEGGRQYMPWPSCPATGANLESQLSPHQGLPLEHNPHILP